MSVIKGADKLFDTLDNIIETLSASNNKTKYDNEIRHIEYLTNMDFGYDANAEILKSLAELKYLIRELTMTIKK